MECERVMVLEEGKVTIGVANILGPDTVANILISFSWYSAADTFKFQ